MLSGLRTSFSWQRRSFGIVFFILGVLALSRIAEMLLLHYEAQNWESIVESKSARQLQSVTEEFAGIQRRLRRIATELARHEDVTDYLLGTTSDLSRLFARADRISRRQDVGVEVYDTDGTLIAWQGRSGFVDQHEIQNALQGILTSYVSRGPIFSHLFVITPVRHEGRILGAVLARQAVEVNYPLSNKFITRAGLAEQLSKDLSVTVEISYGENAEGRKDGRYVSNVLRGIDNRKLAVVSILRPSRSASLERISGHFQKLNVLLVLALLVIAGAYFTRPLKNLTSPFWKSVIITVVIWCVRYVLLWLEIPSLFVELGVFDPRFFASKFGGGIAKSIGEMTITAAALAANAALVTQSVLSAPRRDIGRRLPQPLGILISIGVTTFMFLLLRGYAAVIRSAVFDSTLRFNDPNVVVPSFELGLMMLNLLVIGFCLIVIAVALTLFMVSLFQRSQDDTGSSPWLRVAGLFIVAAILFGVLQETPLMSTTFRLVFGAGILAFSLYVRRRQLRRISPIAFVHAVIVLALSAVFFYPLLDSMIREKDRERVEVFAREAIRPTDVWLRFVVNEALRSFLSDEAFDVLMNGRSEELERLAFTCWAKSTVAQKGYDCSFTLFSSEGKELSRFVVGEQPELAESVSVALRNGTRQPAVHEVGSEIGAIKVYSGSLPIIAADELLGYGAVTISTTNQPLFRSEAPTVFRASPEENLESFYRHIAVSQLQFDQPPTLDPTLPLSYRIPEAVRERFRDSIATSHWENERIQEKDYETFFVRSDARSGSILALRMERLPRSAFLFGVVRMAAYYGIVLAIAVILILVVQWMRGKPYQFTFRDRLLLVLLVVAAIPVIVISAFTREFARERMMDNLSRRLNQEATSIENRVWHTLSHDSVTIAGAARVRAEQLVQGDLDYNFYVDRDLKISSRPELYDSGILDRRLSGTAYFNIVQTGSRFFLETENIGLYQYAVGYRPILDEHKTIAGVVAVPTLYRQEQIDEEVTRTNAVLFGVSAIIFLAIAAIATTFANRIASPIHKLTEATKRVALGDLDVKIRARADGEIGELIQSFESMTRELKNSRENLVQYERELAWKEMAKQVAHEIKNPLTPMKLALQHLRQTYHDRVENFDEIFEEVSRMVIRQVDALSRIASEFSSFARMPKARLEKLSINDVLHEAVHLFEQDIRVAIEVRLEPHLPPIMADREELRRAFINILRNGVQAINGEGKITVTSSAALDEIEVRIQDSGSGIPDEIKSKLFQPNFSTKTDGMGLGLAIVKKTIEDLNGSIAIESVLHEGTTVVIHIPTRQETHGSDTHHPG